MDLQKQIDEKQQRIKEMIQKSDLLRQEKLKTESLIKHQDLAIAELNGQIKLLKELIKEDKK